MSREEKYYWSPQDIADEIGTDKNGLLYVTRQTVRNWFVKGGVPGGKRRGKQWRAPKTKKLLDFCADKRREIAAKPIFQFDPNTYRAKQRLAEAKQSCAEFMESEATYLKLLDQGIKSAHELGKELYELKEKVPRGTWRTFLHTNCKELGGTPSSIESKVRLCIAIWSANQDKSNPSKFSPESVRKFRLALLPRKN
jgi:hypothetical protein